MLNRYFAFFVFFISLAPYCEGKCRFPQYIEKGIDPSGIDCELAKQQTTPQRDVRQSIGSKTCQSMIRFFQVYISPIDGPRSSFIPTSSQYAFLAIQKHGVFKGIALGCDRLMRENDNLWVYRTITFNGAERKFDPPK